MTPSEAFNHCLMLNSDQAIREEIRSAIHSGLQPRRGYYLPTKADFESRHEVGRVVSRAWKKYLLGWFRFLYDNDLLLTSTRYPKDKSTFYLVASDCNDIDTTYHNSTHAARCVYRENPSED